MSVVGNRHSGRPPSAASSSLRRAGRAPWSLAARGVTLIEIMVVIAIVGVIAAIAVPNLSPIVKTQKLAAGADGVASLLDRGRRLAINEGRCYRVRQDGTSLVLERRTSGNCGYCTGATCNQGLNATTGWSAAIATVSPEPGVSFSSVDVTTGSIGAGTANASIIFRPNTGRLVGDGDLDVGDDGARVVVTSTGLDRKIMVNVQSNGRICGDSTLGTVPTLPAQVSCGTGYGTVNTPGNCSAGGGDAPFLAAVLAPLALLMRRSRRRRRERRATDACVAKPTERSKRARGYLLIEVMVSGAILAIILASALSMVATSRQEITRASHRATAASLARYYQQQLASAWPHVASSTCPAGPALAPRYTVTCSVAQSGLHDDSVPELFDDDHLYTITVTVTYPRWNGETATMSLVTYRRNRPFTTL